MHLNWLDWGTIILYFAAVFAVAWVWSLYAPLTQAAERQQIRNLTAVAHAGALVASESSATAATYELGENLFKRLKGVFR